jgi:hypothetical protein
VHAIDDVLNAANRLDCFQNRAFFMGGNRPQKRNASLFDDHFGVRTRRNPPDLGSNTIRKNNITDVFMFERGFAGRKDTFQTMRRIPGGNICSPANQLRTMDC